MVLNTLLKNSNLSIDCETCCGIKMDYTTIADGKVIPIQWEFITEQLIRCKAPKHVIMASRIVRDLNKAKGLGYSTNNWIKAYILPNTFTHTIATMRTLLAGCQEHHRQCSYCPLYINEDCCDGMIKLIDNWTIKNIEQTRIIYPEE